MARCAARSPLFLAYADPGRSTNAHMAPKSALITGAAGFIGSHLAERCLSRGWRVTALDCFTDYYAAPTKRANVRAMTENPGCTLVEADLLDDDLDLAAISRDVNFVFHMAGQPGVRPSWTDFGLYTSHNLDATQRLLEAARGAALDRFVVASSSSVYGDAEALPTPESVVLQPVSPYGVTKVATEHLALAYWRTLGIPTVCLRYFTVYGPRQRPDMAFNRLIASALGGLTFEVFGDGEQSRDFTFVDDAVSGTLAAAENGIPGTVYNIGGGSRRTMNQVLTVLGELLGRRVLRTYGRRQLGDARDTAADISRARQELGFEPTADFDAALKAQLDWQEAAMLTPAAPR
jgi:nucleoside-diphosphate-sugar epimerase